MPTISIFTVVSFVMVGSREVFLCSCGMVEDAWPFVRGQLVPGAGSDWLPSCSAQQSICAQAALDLPVRGFTS